MPLGIDVIQHATDEYIAGQKAPDILGQYQKMQALRTMHLQQQDIASQVQERNAIAAQRQNELRQSTSAAQVIHDHVAGGGTLDDPELQQKLYTVAPKLADSYVTTRSQAAERAATAKKSQYEAEHPKIDPLSPEGQAAQIAVEKGKPRNTDPLSPEGVAAAVARTAQEATIPQRPQGVQQPPQPTPPMSPSLFEQRKGLAKIIADAAAARTAASNPTPDLNSAISTTRSGLKYVDRSQFTGKEANALVDAANKAGIPAVSKEIADLLSEIDNARANLDYMNQAIGSKLAKDPTGRLFQGPSNTIEKLAQSDPDLAAVGTYRSAAIQAMRAVAGAKGLRINRAEIEQAQENDIPKITDTLPTAQSKLKNMMKFLDNAERAHVVRDRSATSGAAAATHRYNPATGQIEAIK